MLKATESEFRRITILRIVRAHEWYMLDGEEQWKRTRMICYFSGNHEAKSPTDLWMTSSELAQRQKDIIMGVTPIATFRKLTPEEVANWKTSKN